MSAELGYDKTNPVIYDNDEAFDVYTDDYLMALAAAGDIQLKGMITSGSVQPYNQYGTPEYVVDKMHAERIRNVEVARAAGFKNIPDPVLGCVGHIAEPTSGTIEDSKPIESEGGKLIVREARAADSEKPLVLVMGGPLTVAVDAYLMDPSIADRILIAWLGSMPDGTMAYNGWADGWAAYVAFERLRTVVFCPLFPGGRQAGPKVTKSRILSDMPDTPLRTFMHAKDHKALISGGCKDSDADGPPAIYLMRSDYVTCYRGVVVDSIIEKGGHRSPRLKEELSGAVIQAFDYNRDTATEEFWRAMCNPAAYA